MVNHEMEALGPQTHQNAHAIYRIDERRRAALAEIDNAAFSQVNSPS
jgi:hypothetical protein